MPRELKTAAAVILASSLVAGTAAAQVVIEGEIRVPVQSVFTVNTTVTVPDRGHTYLGGVRSASSSRNESTGERPRIDSRVVSQGAAAHVRIINLDEMDEQMRGGTGTESAVVARGFAAGIRQYASAPTSGSKSRDVAAPRTVRREPGDANKLVQDDAAKSQESEAQSLREAQAADLLKRGEDAEARGKLKVAQIYFQTAARLAPAPSAKIAQQRIQSLSTKLAGL